MHPSISIVTVVRNNPLVAQAVASVLSQRYEGTVQSIVVDGASTDGTLNALEPFKPRISHLVSEPDQGIYDAMNKGIGLAKGDIVGILNADDIYADDRVLHRIGEIFHDPMVDLCFGDLVFVDPDAPNRIVRYWKSTPYRPGAFHWGWMPPHPTLFVRRQIYELHGIFDTTYQIASDYELMLRFLEVKRLRSLHLPHILVRMRAGGASNRSLEAIRKANRECCEAFYRNGMKPSILLTPLKLSRHALQLFQRPGV